MRKKFLGSDRWRAAATARRDSSKAREEVHPKSSRNSATTHGGPRKRRPFQRRECRSHYSRRGRRPKTALWLSHCGRVNGDIILEPFNWLWVPISLFFFLFFFLHFNVMYPRWRLSRRRFSQFWLLEYMNGNPFLIFGDLKFQPCIYTKY